MAAESQDQVEFVAIAGRSDFGSTAAAASALFSSNVKWGLDDSIWDLYGARYQPVTFMITADGSIADTWPGIRGTDEIRAVIDANLPGV